MRQLSPQSKANPKGMKEVPPCAAKFFLEATQETRLLLRLSDVDAIEANTEANTAHWFLIGYRGFIDADTGETGLLSGWVTLPIGSTMKEDEYRYPGRPYCRWDTSYLEFSSGGQRDAKDGDCESVY